MELYSHLPWREGPIPLETPSGRIVLVRDSSGCIERGILTQYHLRIGGAAYQRDAASHGWISGWCLLSDIDDELVRLSARAALADKLGVLLERFTKLDGAEAYQTTEDFYAEVDAQLALWKASREAT